MLRACLTSKYIQKVGACNRKRATELATAKRTGEKKTIRYGIPTVTAWECLVRDYCGSKTRKSPCPIPNG